MPTPAPMATPAPSPAPEPGLAIAALRERGAQRLDPVRFHFIEALARRAQAHGGEARRVLDARLAQLLAQYGPRPNPAPPDAGAATPVERTARPGPLADLVRHIARSAPGQPNGRPVGAGVGPAASTAELPALDYFRATWARLSVDQQLARSLAKFPENAGPLNSHLLVLRSLQAMREISPHYLNRFISQVDALLWLEQAGAAAAAAPDNGARGEADKKRKPGRGKAG